MTYYHLILRISLVVLCSSFFCLSALAQEPVIFIVDSLGTTVSEEDENLLIVPIRVRNFEEVYGIEFFLSIGDGGTLEPTDAQEFLPEFPNQDYERNSYEVTEGRNLALVTIDLGPDERNSFPDNTILFNLLIRFSGEPGTCIDISIDEVVLVDYEDFAPKLFDIIDDDEVCSPQFVQIVGRVESPVATPVENVEIMLNSEDGEVVLSATTDADGQYRFIELPYGKNYTIRPTVKLDQQFPGDSGLSRGINVNDTRTIRDHRLRRMLFDSPYQFVAADVNGDSTANIFDIVQLYDYILVRRMDFTGGKFWRFIDADYEFQNMTNPLMDDFRELVQLTEMTEDTTVNFIGVKIGDVNFSSY